jgi:hypothetical protein
MMRPDIDGEFVETDHFTECPGCGRIGHTVSTFKHLDDGRVIQLMACPEPRESCAVDQYYPEEVRLDD